MLVVGLLSICLVAQVSYANIATPSRVVALSPKGIEFAVPDSPGISLVAFHYNINKRLPRVKAGQWNYDVTRKTGNEWVHRNTAVSIRNGDTVYYWVFAIKNGGGYHLTDQKWTVGGAPSTGTGGGGSVIPQPGVSKVVFLENFDAGSVDTKVWKYDVSGWGGGNGEFQAYTPDKRTTYIKDGKLVILPKLTEDLLGNNFYQNEEFDFKKRYGTCTQDHNQGCKKPAKYLPMMSGRISTIAAWRYGRFTIRAKMPRGDWLWPAIWLLPKDWFYGTWPKSGEIDIVETRGNRAYGDIGIQSIGSTLHWGLYGDNQWGRTHGSVKANSEVWGQQFHDYVLDWDANGMKFTVDGRKMFQVSTGDGYCRKAGYQNCGAWKERDAPFNKPFYIILNVAVGGTGGFFPDGVVGNKPWKNSDGWNGAINFYNARNQWLKTWDGEEAAMQVDYVKVEKN